MQLCEVIDRLAEVVDGLEPGRLSGVDASRLVILFDHGKRLCEAGKGLAARRAVETKEWTKTGARSPQQWLSDVSGGSPGEAQRTLEAADGLVEHPELDRAVRAGEITSEQAGEIARVTKDHPEAVAGLIGKAKSLGYKGFREACRQVALSSHSREEDQAKARRQRESSYFRAYMESDGMGRLDGRLAPLEFAKFRSLFSPFEREAFDHARQQGRHDSDNRYRVDALIAMAQAAHDNTTTPAGDPVEQPDEHLPLPETDPASKPKRRLPATVIAVIDHAIFERGHALPGERHYIEGIGPVPVSVFEELMQDAILAAVITKGTDIARAVHLGRHPTALQRTALHVRDPHCVIPGCEQTEHLEIDHIPEYAQTHHTTLPELARECQLHHDQRTYQGATLTGSPGDWHWQPPPPEGPFPTAPPGWTGGPFDDQPTTTGPSP